MAVERRWRHADELCRIGEREAAQPPLGDEPTGRLDQGFLEVPVVIPAPVAGAVPMPHMPHSGVVSIRSHGIGTRVDVRRVFDGEPDPLHRKKLILANDLILPVRPAPSRNNHTRQSQEPLRRRADLAEFIVGPGLGMRNAVRSWPGCSKAQAASIVCLSTRRLPE